MVRSILTLLLCLKEVKSIIYIFFLPTLTDCFPCHSRSFYKVQPCDHTVAQKFSDIAQDLGF